MNDSHLSFEYLNKCIRPKYVPMEDVLWSMAHHKLGVLVSNAPHVIDPTITTETNEFSNDSLAVTAAYTHFTSALKHPDANSSEIHFDISKNIIKQIRNAVSQGHPFEENLGALEDHLHKATKGASQSSSWRSRMKVFYRCLILAEFHLLSASADHVEKGLSYFREALIGQPLEMNLELHAFVLKLICSSAFRSSLPFSFDLGLNAGVALLQNHTLLIRRDGFAESNSLDYAWDEHNAVCTMLFSSASRRVEWIKKDFHNRLLSSPGSYRAGTLTWSLESPFPHKSTHVENRSAGRKEILGNIPEIAIKTKPTIEKSKNNLRIVATGGRNEPPLIKSQEDIPTAPIGIAPPPRRDVSASPLISPAVPTAPAGIKPPPLKRADDGDNETKIPNPEIKTHTVTYAKSSLRRFWDSLTNFVSSLKLHTAQIFEIVSAMFSSSRSILRPSNSWLLFKSTDTAYFLLCVLSHLSRMDCFLLSNRIAATHGTKFQAVWNSVDKGTRMLWSEINSMLMDFYSSSLPRITKIDELLHLRKDYSSVLFKGESKGIRQLLNLDKINSFTNLKDIFLLSVMHPRHEVLNQLPKIEDLISLETTHVNKSSTARLNFKWLSQSLDSTFTGLRDYFARCLAPNECQFVWHMPGNLDGGENEPITLIIVYRSGKYEKITEEDIVIKALRSDIGSLQIRYLIQGLISSLALLTRRRWSASTDALRQISAQLALGEVLSLLPERIETLTIVCPCLLRVIPWHLLYVEMLDKSTKQPAIIEIQIIDRYAVTVEHSMSIYELSCIESDRFDHEPSSYKMVCIDGGYISDSLIDDDGPSPSQLEIACVSSIWSDDLSDVKVLSEEHARRGCVSTLMTREHSIGVPDFQNLDGDEDDQVDRDEQLHFARFLYNCRVLHVVCNQSGAASGSLELPGSKMSATDVVSRIHLNNCGLCVLSNYTVLSGVTIDVIPDESSSENIASDGQRKVREAFDLIDAFHIVGATATMFPLWDVTKKWENDSNTDLLGRFAHLIFMIKFYSELPNFASKKQSTAFAIRSAQLWLRDSSKAEIISFLHRSPIFKDLREKLVHDLNTYMSHYLTVANAQHMKMPNMVSDSGDALDKEDVLFGHFFYFGPFIACGHGGNVHHPDIVENMSVSDN